MDTMSSSIAALAAALAKAQGQMGHAAKDSTNPHFKSRYADLASVIDAIREPLAANGLSIVQTVTQADSTVGVRTILMHSSGEYISSDLQMPVAQKTPQGVGSALSYARRYSISALCNVAQADDDGEAATRGSAPVLPPVQRRTPIRESRGGNEADSGMGPPPPPAATPDADPVERALVAITEAQTGEDLQAVTKLVMQLGVQKSGEVRQAFAAKQKALRGAA